MNDHRKKVHILYEYGDNKRPYGGSSLRLLRPLSHPALQSKLQVTTGRTYDGEEVDAVIVDRLWRPDISLALTEALLTKIRAHGARLIYALDDNFLDLPAQRKDWPREEHLRVVRFLLSEADSVWVTTPLLKGKFADFNRNIVVLPNALDERLLPAWPLPEQAGQEKIRSKISRYLDLLSRCGPGRLKTARSDKKVIGYMGTLTHDDDLMMILPALQSVGAQFRQQVSFEFVGVVRHAGTRRALEALPARFYKLTPRKVEYVRFMRWFTRCLSWDIAISPLQDTPFNRCKSDIKFLDYSAIGAAGIFSGQIPVYQGSVRHLETGWLADNTVESWVAAFEELITNDSLREQLAHNATRYLYTERILARCAHQWGEAINMLAS